MPRRRIEPPAPEPRYGSVLDNPLNYPRADYDRPLEVRERRWLAHRNHDCTQATVCTLLAGQQSACCDRHGVPAQRSSLNAEHRISLVVMPAG